jgi:hypothetical protein
LTATTFGGLREALSPDYPADHPASIEKIDPLMSALAGPHRNTIS